MFWMENEIIKKKNEKYCMIINNKIESLEKIIELKLNKLPEKIFKKGEESKVIDFIEQYPAEFYAIRDKSRPCGIFKLKVPSNKIIEEIKDYDLFTINVSSANYEENQLLVGEVEFFRNGDVYCCVSTNNQYSVRDACKNPDFNLKTNIFDKTLNDIPYFDDVYEYISRNELYDIIVEFALFDKNVGIYSENIIIYEIRTHY